MQGLGQVFTQQPALAQLVADVLSDLQTEEAVERPVGTLSPLDGPLIDGCQAVMPYLEWHTFFEQLAEQAGKEPISVDPVGVLRFEEGRFFVDFVARPVCHPNLEKSGEWDRAAVDARVDGFRIRPLKPDAEDAVDGQVGAARIYVRRFDPERFHDRVAFLAHDGIAEHDVQPADRNAWFNALIPAGRAEPWAVDFRRAVESLALMTDARFLHALFRCERRAGSVLPGSIQMFAAYDTGWVSARYAFEKDHRDRKILKRIRKRNR